MKMYYVVEPFTTNGNRTINSAPGTVYYTNLRKATAAAKKLNRELLSWMEKGYNDKADILAEQGAFVVQVVWDSTSSGEKTEPNPLWSEYRNATIR